MTATAEKLTRIMRRDPADTIVKSLQGELGSMYRRADNEAWIFERITKHKNDWYYPLKKRMCKSDVDGVDRRMPAWAETQLYAIDTLLWHQHQARLVWTHLWKPDGRRLISQHPDITDYGPDGIDIDKSYHCFAYELDGKVVWLPGSEDDRAQEIADGRLTQEQVERCTKVIPEGVRLIIRHKPNGTSQLMKPVPIDH